MRGVGLEFEGLEAATVVNFVDLDRFNPEALKLLMDEGICKR